MGAKNQKTISQTLGQRTWSWGVVGAIVLGIFIAGGYSFMTSGYPFIADIFFLLGAFLFLFKFFTWELPRQHIKKRLILITASIITVIIVAGFICINHYLNTANQNATNIKISEILMRQAPRSIDPTKIDNSINMLSSLRGESLNIIKLGDQEASNLADEIIFIMQQAGIHTNISIIGIMIPAQYGIIISDDLSPNMQNILVKTFNSLGLKCIVRTSSQPHSILIGLKP